MYKGVKKVKEVLYYSELSIKLTRVCCLFLLAVVVASYFSPARLLFLNNNKNYSVEYMLFIQGFIFSNFFRLIPDVKACLNKLLVGKKVFNKW